MKLEHLKPGITAACFWDQADNDYIVDENGTELAVHVSGHYTVAELETKLVQLKEANKVCHLSTADHTPSTIAKTKKGDYIRLKVNGPVWVRGDYDRASRKFSIHKFDDVNHEAFKRGDLVVYVGFTF